MLTMEAKPCGTEAFSSLLSSKGMYSLQTKPVSFPCHVFAFLYFFAGLFLTCFDYNLVRIS